MAIKRTGVRFPGRTALWVEGFRLRYRLTVDPLRSAATARDARMRTRVRIGYSRASLRAISSAGERFVHTEEVTGSIPVSPTAIHPGHRPFPRRRARPEHPLPALLGRNLGDD